MTIRQRNELRRRARPEPDANTGDWWVMVGVALIGVAMIAYALLIGVKA